jgi:orotidine-5'-phosphate decarboxylase
MIIDKYNKRAKAIDSLLCVGLDADYTKIPERFLKVEFPQFEFNKYLIEQTHEFAATFKLNSAFYEARGDQGIKELKMTMEYLIENHPEIFTILDAKRADIGKDIFLLCLIGWDLMQLLCIHISAKKP